MRLFSITSYKAAAIAVTCALGIGTALAMTDTVTTSSARNINWAAMFPGDAFYTLGTAFITIKETEHAYEQTDCPATFTLIAGAKVTEKKILNYTPTFVGNNPAQTVNGAVSTYTPPIIIPVGEEIQIITYQIKTLGDGTKQYVASLKKRDITFSASTTVNSNNINYAIFPPAVGFDITPPRTAQGWYVISDVVICQKDPISSSSSSSSDSSESFVSSSSSSAPYCGDMVCDASEDYVSCPDDCSYPSSSSSSYSSSEESSSSSVATSSSSESSSSSSEESSWSSIY